MKKPPRYTSSKPSNLSQTARRSGRVLLGSALLAACAAPAVLGQDAGRLEKLEHENQALKARLDSLEAMAQKEGLAPSGPPDEQTVKAFSDITLSGFVTASYFYDMSDPKDRKSNGYLWNTSHNSFSLNKVKLTLASKPVERSGDTWDAAYRVSMMWGEDASVVNTGGELQGMENLREAYVEVNAPIGTGLNIKAGQLISLLNYESGDGGAVNANFSQGYQWYYTGNGPSAGVQAGYTFLDWLDVKVRLQNSMYPESALGGAAVNSNNSHTFMGAIGIKPCKDLWFSLIGFAGEETDTMDVSGASLLAGWQITEALGTGFEFDYFKFDPDGSVKGDLWSVGGWLTYDFNPKAGVAFRAEYLDDPDGLGIPGLGLGGRPGSAILSPDNSGNLGSLTLTFNWKPVPYLKVQPECRYDFTSYKDGFDGVETRWIVGAGISYLF